MSRTMPRTMPRDGSGALAFTGPASGYKGAGVTAGGVEDTGIREAFATPERSTVTRDPAGWFRVPSGGPEVPVAARTTRTAPAAG